MATTINNAGEGTGAGTILGIVVAVIIIALLFIYGLPALRGTTTDTSPAGTNVNISLPAADTSGNNTGGGDTGGTNGTGTGSGTGQ